MKHRRPPGEIRDAIIEFLKNKEGDAGVREIHAAVTVQIGNVSSSSVRSYLRLNTPLKFKRTSWGRYKLAAKT